jgi:hypothetical protein
LLLLVIIAPAVIITMAKVAQGAGLTLTPRGRAVHRDIHVMVNRNVSETLDTDRLQDREFQIDRGENSGEGSPVSSYINSSGKKSAEFLR